MKKICGIYMIRNLANGKVYIGQTVDLERRIRDHTTYYKHESNPHLERAIDKYGLGNFSITLLDECPVAELDKKEIYYIAKYQSTNRTFGYNILSGGNKPPNFSGKRHSEATKLLMSEKAKGNQAWLGKHHTQETKDKKSELASGNKHYFFGKKRANATSKYFGVCKWKDSKSGKIYYRAKISVNGNLISIGQSTDEIVCAKLYDNYILRAGLPNPLNFGENPNQTLT